MTKKRWSIVLIAAILLFATVNIVLISKEKSKVARVHSIHQWKTIQTGSLEESFVADGVVSAADKHYIYVDKEAPFLEFLVEVGDEVSRDTPLFEYANPDLEKQQELLNLEIDRLEKEKRSIEDAIGELENILASLPASRPHTYGSEEDKIIIVEQQEETAYRIEADIAEKELEKSKVEHAIDKYEQQLLLERVSDISVVSGYAGKVADIAYNLDNPVITIMSGDAVVEGLFTEEERSLVEQDMDVQVSSELFKEKMTGTLQSIREVPEQKPDVKTEAAYPFTIALEEIENENIYPGYHVKAKIILDEATTVPLVPEKSLVGSKNEKSIYVLNDKGLIEKKPLKTGIQVNGKAEVVNGAKEGDWYVAKPKGLQTNQPFITPLKVSKLKKTTFRSTPTKTKVKYVLIGALQR
ncbi:efflux RND transporter periplasmic adaptor subunit [Bacillus chungangensis]|uniref:HlyD family secretion protein n=1 Tax=Bacillus chungangensis TaxID=587633 RepID=A0ABT9WV31_9BACI|nr:efflux RND transporter periplasmic adaptor subunit [Bacillus chungangensis]MDQ0177161.1 HlyD family secretion protein [Bacillus chungangensis]